MLIYALPDSSGDLAVWLARLIEHGYTVMFLVMLLEGPLVTIAGAFAAALGYFNVFLVFLISFVGNLLPDALFYTVGYLGGNRVLRRFGPKLGLAERRQARFTAFIHRNSPIWMLSVKAVPFLGPAGLAVMGAVRVPVGNFLLWNAALIGSSSLLFTIVGYSAGLGYEALLRYTNLGIYGAVGIFAGFFLAAQGWQLLARKYWPRLRAQLLEDAPPPVAPGPSLRILLANDTYPPQLNGAAVTTQRLARGLASRGHTVAVLGPNVRFKDEAEAEFAHPSGGSVTVYRCRSVPLRPFHPHMRMLWPLGLPGQAARRIQEFRPDVIHIQNHFQLGKACLREARRQGIPIVGSNHFMPLNLFEFIPRPLQPWLSRLMWRDFLKVYNRLDCVTAPSQAALRMILDLGLTAPAQVISNGLDLERHGRVAVSDAIYAKYGIRRDRPVFLTVGRQEWDKGIHLIIEATAQVTATTPIQVVTVGRGRDETEFKEMARRLGLLGDAVIFTGAVAEDELRQLYSLADVYIGAGAAELQGLAVMEAMAAGLPVLAANEVALPELAQNGGNGYLFSLSAAALADGMRRMLAERSEWPRMGQRSLELIQPHSYSAVLTQYEELHRSAARSRRSPFGAAEAAGEFGDN